MSSAYRRRATTLILIFLTLPRVVAFCVNGDNRGGRIARTDKSRLHAIQVFFRGERAVARDGGNNSINISTLARAATLSPANERRIHSWSGPSLPRGKFDEMTGLIVARQSATDGGLTVLEFARASKRARVREIDNRERKRIHKFRDAARVRLYENYKAINYDRDKLSSRGAIIEREPR